MRSFMPYSELLLYLVNLFWKFVTDIPWTYAADIHRLNTISYVNIKESTKIE
jgi:hypothetical protein